MKSLIKALKINSVARNPFPPVITLPFPVKKQISLPFPGIKQIFQIQQMAFSLQINLPAQIADFNGLGTLIGL